jgi:coiled-coil domain-containing protein 40
MGVEPGCVPASFPPSVPLSTGLSVRAQEATRRREDVGVELYGFQQQLAMAQLQLEQSADDLEAQRAVRLEANEQLAQARKAAEEEQRAVAAVKAQVLWA